MLLAGWGMRVRPIVNPYVVLFFPRYTSIEGTRCNDRRVVRGGSWNNNPQNLRSANRNRNNTDESNNNTGFRVASTPAILPELDDSWIIQACRRCPCTLSPGCAIPAAKESAVFGRQYFQATHEILPFPLASHFPFLDQLSAASI
ncbi:MAG: SUMF1/EgtB/PvdO family nonheme iron enzyme [Nitrosomonas sp.]|nr:SUMF1/EgtB/PvdO family nonheme iron enzyme [Nitrosomonas sp.]